MKRWIIGCLVALTPWVSSAEALTQTQAERAARWAGFTGPVFVNDADSLNGGFGILCDYTACTPAIVLYQPANTPDDWMYLILFHELGHWVQYRDGYIHDMESIDREWQADIWGLRAMQAYGVPLMTAHDLWTAMIARYGNSCSWSHGCLLDRLENLMREVKRLLHAIPEAAFRG